MKNVVVGLLLLCIATLGCGPEQQMMMGMGGSGTEEPTVTEEPMVTEEPTVLEPPPGVERLEGCVVPKGYIPVNVAPDNSIVLAPLHPLTLKEDPSSDKPRLAMYPSCEHIFVYGFEFDPPIHNEVWLQDDGTLKLTLTDVAFLFDLPFCDPPTEEIGDDGEIVVIPPEQEGCILYEEPEPEPEPERPLW